MAKLKEDFLNEISEKFSINKTNTPQLLERKSLVCFWTANGYMLKARDSILASNALSKSIAETLDVSILQDFY